MLAAVRRRWLWFVRNGVNRVTMPIARSSRGPFSLVRHAGRRSGRVYETPLLLVRVPGGFVAELTYGEGVDWYRNVVAGGGTVVHHRVEYPIVAVEPLSAADGYAAFGPVERTVLRLLRRRTFRLLRTSR